jgi:hypothetical protein
LKTISLQNSNAIEKPSTLSPLEHIPCRTAYLFKSSSSGNVLALEGRTAPVLARTTDSILTPASRRQTNPAFSFSMLGLYVRHAFAAQ